MVHGRDNPRSTSDNGAIAHADRKKVVIVDDSWSVRAWLRAVLEEDHRLQVVGEAENADKAGEWIDAARSDATTA